MGIDIYMVNREAERRRKAKIAKFQDAVKLRDAQSKGSAKAEAAQLIVDQTYDAAYSGANGYLRSSYNSSGMFNVYDRIFGTDSGALLFPGDWSKPMKMNWPEFVATVKRMQAVARCLKHGDPLPVALEELAAAPSQQRAHAEAFGKSVLSMIAGAFGDDNVESGRDGQHGFYNDDDYGWYVHEGLDDLLAFGELGLATGSKVTISY